MWFLRRDHVDRVGRDFAFGRGADRWFEDERAQAFGDGGGDFCDEVLGGFRQHRVAAAGDELRAEDGGFDFVGGQHQGRQVEAAFQDVAHAGFAADGDTLAHSVATSR